MKLYHWKTKIYSRHIASGNFVDSINNKMDRMIESLSGINNKKINDVFVLNFEGNNDKNIIDSIECFKIFLQKDWKKYVDKINTDVYNRRDEILSEVNIMLYLFTFK